jgi:hypothetical protein
MAPSREKELTMKGLSTGRRGALGGAAAGLLLVVGGGVALATVPDSGGVIHGCYAKKSGDLRVIDTEMPRTCRKAERELSWSQQGPPGQDGPPGPEGPPGASAAFATPTGEPVEIVAPFSTVAELRVPAGSYVVNASVTFENGEPDGAIAVCAIGGRADGAAGILELQGQTGPETINVGMMSLLFADTFTEPFTLRINCRNNASDVGGLSANNIHLVATQVSTLYGSRWTPPPAG